MNATPSRSSVGRSHIPDRGERKLDPPRRNDPASVEENMMSSGFTALTGKNEIADHLHSDEFVNEVDKHCYKIALYSIVVFVILTALTYFIYWDHLERLDGLEQKASALSCLFIGMTCVTTMIPLFVRGKKRSRSGVLFASVTVQFVAFITDLMLASVPVPVYVHPFSGTRVFLLRWCEWTPLAFVMTFLADFCRAAPSAREFLENSDSYNVRINHLLTALRVNAPVPPLNDVAKGDDDATRDGDSDHDLHVENSQDARELEQQREVEIRVMKNLRPSYVVALSQGCSTFGGWLLPLVDNIWLHCTVLVISFCLFSVILVRAHAQGQVLKTLKTGVSVAEKEVYKWAKLSLQQLRLCAALWTGLVISYFCYTFGPLLGPTWLVFQGTDLTLIVECLIDVMYKAMYMIVIVEVHDTIFDPKARACRWLEELQQMMGVVWENSSDVICISVKGANGDVSTILSPTYLKIYSRSTAVSASRDEKIQMRQKGIAFVLDASVLDNLSSTSDADHQKTNIVPSNVYDVNFDEGNTYDSGSIRISERDELSSFAQLVTRSWKAKNEANSLVLMHDLKRMDQEQPQPIQCEAKISVMEEHILVIVVRDISERFRRFEAEKRVISETTARRKDVAANRFTRHEVKNGLLAAIGLCDSMKEVTEGDAQMILKRIESNSSNSDVQDLCTTISNDRREPSTRTHCIVELGNTLTGILDTVLTEAMVRDVIHEVYEPKIENVNLSNVLATTMSASKNRNQKRRFPIVTNPDPLPGFSTDPHLWKYVHRNAISNACKYGKLSGEVTTEILWDEVMQVLTVNVINLPGNNHAEMSAMGAKSNSTIFSLRKKLKVQIDGSGSSADQSVGNGTWLMTKCAATLGGQCSIKFEEERTVFSFACPVKIFDAKEDEMRRKLKSTFMLPPNVYGVAIDDSKVQRRMMTIFFRYIGIPDDKIHILGQESSEITGFEDWAQNFIFNHPNDFFLFIVDENLMVNDNSQYSQNYIFSGSKAVSDLRSRLLPDQEKKVLALIRSANDSPNDIAIYNSRAHGHISKAPIRAESCIDLIAPLWIARFPQLISFSSESLIVAGKVKNQKNELVQNISNMRNASWGINTSGETKTAQNLHGLTRRQNVRPGISPESSSRNGIFHNTSEVNNAIGERQGSERRIDIDSGNNASSPSSIGNKRPRDNREILESLELKRPRLYSTSEEMEDHDEDDMITIDDLVEHISGLDGFSDLNEYELNDQWERIWNKLHALKGDLLIIESPSKNVRDALDIISCLRTSKEKFKENWRKIRYLLLGS